MPPNIELPRIERPIGDAFAVIPCKLFRGDWDPIYLREVLVTDPHEPAALHVEGSDDNEHWEKLCVHPEG